MPVDKPYGYTIFCDDFRRDDKGRGVYTGVYTTDIVLDSDTFPIIVPMLSIVCVYIVPKSGTVKTSTLRIFLPGEDTPVFSKTIDCEPYTIEDYLPSHFFEAEAQVDYLESFIIPIIFSPLVIKDFGFIKVRVYYGDEEVRIGAIYVWNGKSE